jgi:chaperonin cofactor prefoldin
MVREITNHLKAVEKLANRAPASYLDGSVFALNALKAEKAKVATEISRLIERRRTIDTQIESQTAQLEFINAKIDHCIAIRQSPEFVPVKFYGIERTYE